MTVGLPSAGIGGLFYLVAGLLMPVRELALTVAGRSSRARWQAVLQQFSLAAGIFGGTWVSGWLLATLLARLARVAPGGAPAAGSPTLQQTADWLRPTHGLVQLLTLAAIVGLTWAAGAIVGRTPAATPARAEPDATRRPAPRPARDPRIPTPGPRSAHDLRIPTPMPTPWRHRSRREE